MIGSARFLDIVRDRKSNVVGAAVKIYAQESVLGQRLPQMQRRAIAGSPNFWTGNGEEIMELLGQFERVVEPVHSAA